MEDAKLFLDKKYKINTGRMRNFLLANSYQLCYHLFISIIKEIRYL